MTRQEAVIKISKINRIIGEWKRRLDIERNIKDMILASDAIQIGEWVQEIQIYLEQNPSRHLSLQITNIGFTDMMATFVNKHGDELGSEVANALECYVKRMYSLQSLCDKQALEQKGQYSNLPGPLANEQVALLLQRAVNAGILDCQYQPMPQTKVLQLRFIAFAISSICGFRHPYVYFEQIWSKKNGARISSNSIPRYKNVSYEQTKALYPEVDFLKMENEHETETFYTPQGEEDKKRLFKELVKYKYIASDTSQSAFMGIFDKNKFRQPIEWLKDQRQLGYFIYSAFGASNKKRLWIKGECCFRINSAVPHRQCLSNGYSCIKRAGLLESYDTRLKAICDRFNHVTNEATLGSTPCKRPIHTGKDVFHSSQSDAAKRKMYNALIKGEYIAAETTFFLFKGIFDESLFTEPVKWIKSQSKLMYLIYMAFKEDNPYDIWRKCSKCFYLRNGKKPNRESMCTNIRSMIKKGQLETYNEELKAIAASYVGSRKSELRTNSQATVDMSDNNHISNPIKNDKENDFALLSF